LTVPLSTLLGLAQAPGEAAGYGPLDPDTARALACATAGHRGTRWHMTVTSPAGRALGHGAARATATGDGQWTVQVTAEPIATGCCEHGNAEPGYRPSPGPATAHPRPRHHLLLAWLRPPRRPLRPGPHHPARRRRRHL
jgi:hypothetical protein